MLLNILGFIVEVRAWPAWTPGSASRSLAPDRRYRQQQSESTTSVLAGLGVKLALAVLCMLAMQDWSPRVPGLRGSRWLRPPRLAEDTGQDLRRLGDVVSHRAMRGAR